jgi:hypothetical protein
MADVRVAFGSAAMVDFIRPECWQRLSQLKGSSLSTPAIFCRFGLF